MTLSEVYVTKMSHDLAGIIGALHNTAELAEMDAAFTAEGLSLLKNSAGALTARLKFFRALLGLETKIETATAAHYLKTITSCVRLDGAADSRLSLAFVLLAAECLIRGGTITILPGTVKFAGETVVLDTVKESILTGKNQVLNPQYAAALWIAERLKQDNKTLCIQKTPGELIFSFDPA